MMRYIVLMLPLVAVAFGQPTPTITNITNAAIPAMDQHAPVRLQPRSMATIFGSNLSTATMSTTPPWVTSLGGIELHFVPLYVGCGTSSAPANCDITANLIFVSPTQINFLVPDILPSAYKLQELVIDTVLVNNGQRFDSGILLYVSPLGDFALFEVGYDCDFSLSATTPQSCGYSQTPGQNAVPIGAVTDALGGLVTSQNPVHQGQVVVLWATGLGSMSINQSTGLRQQPYPSPITFGILQSNATGGSNVFSFNWKAQTPVWAGESPQYVGLDQVNVALPTCNGATTTIEERYAMSLTFAAHDNSGYPANAFETLYLPFIISPGEATCQFGATTTTTVTSSANPASGTQAIVMTASVSPSNATGTVTFSEGGITLGIAALNAGTASYPIYTSPSAGLGTGHHLIAATYSGNSTYAGSVTTISQSVQQQPVQPTRTTVTSTANPSLVGQGFTLKATVSPCCLPTGSVTFSVGSLRLRCAGSTGLTQGQVTCQTSGFEVLSGPQTSVGAGTYNVTATYNGDNNYASSTAAVTQVIQPNQSTVALNAWSYRGGNTTVEAAIGETVSFSASVRPSVGLIPTGTVTVFDGATVLGTIDARSGQVGPSISNLGLGSHSIKALYSGDVNFAGATSEALTITIWNASTFTSAPNPSSSGKLATFTLCGIPSYVTSGYVMFIIDGVPDSVRIASPCTSDGVNWLVSGTHLAKVGLVDIVNRSVLSVLFPLSITQIVN